MPNFKVRCELTVTMDIDARTPEEAQAIAENALHEELEPAGYDFKNVRSLGLVA